MELEEFVRTYTPMRVKEDKEVTKRDLKNIFLGMEREGLTTSLNPKLAEVITNAYALGRFVGYQESSC